MGAHAGIFFFDRRPAGAVCRALIAGLQPLAPDGVSVHAENGVAMAVGSFELWVGEASSQQPRQSSTGLVLAWDGRLDNRDDFLCRLGLRDETSDAAIVLAAFERWGAEAWRSFIGEWSAAIWDGACRTLHLARDYVGARPLYYVVDDEAVMWSSSLAELVQRTGRADALSDEFVARLITLHLSSDVTPYNGIRAVPAATCVSFASPRMETRRRFWDVEPDQIRFRDRRQYEEQLRALWRDAVGARLRTHDTVWAELSGGLDSSSVVCMADFLIRNGRVPARAVQPVSHVTLQSPEGDERRFISAIEAQIGVRSEILGVEEHQHRVDPDLNWVSPFASSGVGLACMERVRDAGGRLVLSGRVGDAVMGCEPDNSVAVLEELAEWRWFTALSKTRAWSRATRKPFVSIGWNLFRSSLDPGFIPDRAHEYGVKEIRLLTPRLQELAVADDRSVAQMLAAIRPSKRPMARLLLAYSRGARLDIPHQPPGVTMTYPFTHRPLVEFMLAIPGEEWSAPGNMRALMRRAFSGFVPARVLRRTSKGYYPPAALRAARPLAASLLPVKDLEVVRRGWIEGSQLESAVRMLIDGGGNGAEVEPVLRLEQWLTLRSRRGPAAIPEGKEVTRHEVLNA